MDLLKRVLAATYTLKLLEMLLVVICLRLAEVVHCKNHCWLERRSKCCGGLVMGQDMDCGIAQRWSRGMDEHSKEAKLLG